ncbi:MAG: TPM domain-containing protein [Candidatus Wallbacteria bacterium]
MQKLYKFLLITFATLALVLGGYVYYLITYETGIIKINGFVNDYTQKLSPEFQSSIQKVAQELSEKTKIDIVSVILNNTRPYDTSEYASRLLKNYESAHTEIAGTIIILINLEKGVINLDVSPRAQFVFPLAEGQKIIEEFIIPMFNEANKIFGEHISKKGTAVEALGKANELIGRGVLDGVTAIAKKIHDEDTKQKFTEEMIKLRKQEDERNNKKISFSPLFYIGLIIIIMVILLIRKIQGKLSCPKCYHHLKITEETIEIPENDKPGLVIEVVQCNHCGYYNMTRIVTYARSFYLSHLYEVLIDIVKNYYRRKKREYRKKNYDDDK